ncbi:MAG: hypothetical protein A2Y56_03590, partial [Candidatus Aminicenantes bacterium RBG_13_63_10]
MAIKRCPYCRSIIDEKDQYCNNCGTQLLFPEDEFIEEDIPGERVLDLEEAPSEEKLEDELIIEEPEPAPASPASSTFDFPERLTADSTVLPPAPIPAPPAVSTRSGKDKDIHEPAPAPPIPVVPPQEVEPEAEAEPEVEVEVMGEAEAEEAPSDRRTSAELRFEETFPSKPAPAPASTQAKAPTQPPLPSRSPSATGARMSDTRGQTSLSASSEEIEDIVRIMSSLGKDARESTGAKLDKKGRASAMNDEFTPKPEQDVEAPRSKTAHSTHAEKKAASGELSDSAAGIPPWATGMRVEPSGRDKIDLPGLEPEAAPKPESDIPAGLDDFFSSIEKHAAEASAGSEKPPSKSWADIPDREEAVLESLSDRLGRERRERVQEMPQVRRRTGGGSKLKAK